MKFIFYLILTLLFFGAATLYFMDIVPTSFGLHSKTYSSSNVAMDGFDIYNYFSKKNAKKGTVMFSHKFGDSYWFFKSGANMKSFIGKPQRYIPQFGGYCTYTMGSGFTHPPDPNIWRLHNGRIYFFKDEEAKKLALADWANVLDNAKLHWNE
jgi:hypothetical protein